MYARLIALPLLFLAVASSDARAQVTPFSYSVEISGYIEDDDAEGFESGVLDIGAAFSFGSSCLDSFFWGTVGQTNSGVSFQQENNGGGLYGSARLIGGTTGAMVRCTNDGFIIDILDSQGKSIRVGDPFHIPPGDFVDVVFWSGDTSGAMQFELLAGTLEPAVLDYCEWWRSSANGSWIHASCDTLGCFPEVDKAGCEVTVGSAGASVSPTEVHLYSSAWVNEGAGVSIGFALDAPCCVTYRVESSTYANWSVDFLWGIDSGGADELVGRVIIPAGEYTASADGYDFAYTRIELHFSYDICDEDCDQDGELDWNQIAWGLAPDVNANGVPDICDRRRGDLNLDSTVGPPDLALLLAAWGQSLPIIGDLSGDGVVNSSDLSVLFMSWDG